nr:hypothetical protein [Tanacetum cinerariifolium]
DDGRLYLLVVVFDKVGYPYPLLVIFQCAGRFHLSLVDDGRLYLLVVVFDKWFLFTSAGRVTFYWLFPIPTGWNGFCW